MSPEVQAMADAYLAREAEQRGVTPDQLFPEPEPLKNDSIYEQFITANLKFMECLITVPKDDVSSMGAGALDSMCQKEKIVIKKILESNQMTMTSIVKDRIYKLNANKKYAASIDPSFMTRYPQPPIDLDDD